MSDFKLVWNNTFHSLSFPYEKGEFRPMKKRIFFAYSREDQVLMYGVEVDGMIVYRHDTNSNCDIARPLSSALLEELIDDFLEDGEISNHVSSEGLDPSAVVSQAKRFFKEDRSVMSNEIYNVIPENVKTQMEEVDLEERKKKKSNRPKVSTNKQGGMPF